MLGAAAPRVSLALLIAAATAAQAAPQTPTCSFRGAPDALPERPSPLDSVLVPLGDAEAKLCYGRPAAEGVARVGAEFPYGSPWQMGANEPTTLHLPVPARLGDVDLAPGSYSLYAIPEPGAWTIVVNGNPDRWGVPIGADVRASDIGSFPSAPAELEEYVDRLTFSFQSTGFASGRLIYSWERTSLMIPLARR
jgi:hypothetical protein